MSNFQVIGVCVNGMFTWLVWLPLKHIQKQKKSIVPFSKLTKNMVLEGVQDKGKVSEDNVFFY